MSQKRNNEDVVERDTHTSTKENDYHVKAYFLPRVIAYVLDFFLIVLLASIAFSFFPQAGEVVRIQDEIQQTQEKFLGQEINAEEYVAQTLDLQYDMDYQSVSYGIIEIALMLCYFVIFQAKRNGQTIGKRLMRVRVVASQADHELTMNHYLYRALLLQGILFRFVQLIGVLIFNRNLYGAFAMGISVLQGIVNIITICMILYRKDGRGIHDIIAGTKVVMDGSKERVLCEN